MPNVTTSGRTRTSQRSRRRRAGLIRHGEIFSHVMHGATLLYNLALSELRGRDDWAADYRERIVAWVADLDRSAVSGWSLDDFWNTVEHPAHSIRPAAKRFVMQWLELVVDGATADRFGARRTAARGRARTTPENQSIAIHQSRCAGSLGRRLGRRPPQLSLEPGEIASPRPGPC